MPVRGINGRASMQPAARRVSVDCSRDQNAEAFNRDGLISHRLPRLLASVGASRRWNPSMLIYDRRRCRPPQAREVRMRLTLPQRAKLGQLEREGWRLLFVRGETSLAFLTHTARGYAALGREGRLIMVRTLPLRQDDSDGLLDAAHVHARGRLPAAQAARA